MSTIYTFHRELASLATPAAGDRIPVADISTGSADSGRTKKDMTLTVWGGAAGGNATTELLGFYGATPVDQGTFTASCISALATNPTISSSTATAAFGWASSTVASAYVTRIQQMQADLDTLMAKVNSTGLINITGL